MSICFSSSPLNTSKASEPERQRLEALLVKAEESIEIEEGILGLPPLRGVGIGAASGLVLGYTFGGRRNGVTQTSP